MTVASFTIPSFLSFPSFPSSKYSSTIHAPPPYPQAVAPWFRGVRRGLADWLRRHPLVRQRSARLRLGSPSPALDLGFGRVGTRLARLDWWWAPALGVRAAHLPESPVKGNDPRRRHGSLGGVHHPPEFRRGSHDHVYHAPLRSTPAGSRHRDIHQLCRHDSLLCHCRTACRGLWCR